MGEEAAASGGMAVPGARPRPAARGVRVVVRELRRSVAFDRLSLVAAGCAFWGTLALFPAIGMLVSLYGLLFDPVTVEPQLAKLQELLPPGTFTLIARQVHILVYHGGGSLRLNLSVTTVLTMLSASTGTKSVLAALSLGHGTAERRGFLRFQAIGLLMTVVAIVGAVIAVAILVFIPAAIRFLGLWGYARTLIGASSLAVLIAFVALSMSMLYRFGAAPGRDGLALRWITPGSLLATALWLAASLVFSAYVTHLANYNAVYGPLGAVVGVMMWFWVTAYVVLLGAELNAVLDPAPDPARWAE